MAEVYECGNCFKWVTSANHVCFAADPKTRKAKFRQGGTMSEKVLAKETVMKLAEFFADWLQHRPSAYALTESHEALRAERDALKVLATYWYMPDGSIVTLPEDEVTAKRIEAAQELAALRSEVERMREHADRLADALERAEALLTRANAELEKHKSGRNLWHDIADYFDPADLGGSKDALTAYRASAQKDGE